MATSTTTDPTEPLLDLATLTPQASIRVDGKRYGLLNVERLDILGCYDLSDKLKRFLHFGELEAQHGRLTKKEAHEFMQLADALVRSVLQAPKAVIDRIADVQKVQVVKVFIERSLPFLVSLLSGTPVASAKTTSASRLRGSRGSTAATR